MTFFAGIDHMREWCWTHNQAAQEHGYKRWLYVGTDKRDDGSQLLAIKELTGHRACEVIDIPRIGLPVFVGWKPYDVEQMHRALRFMLRRGMPEDIYNLRFHHAATQGAQHSQTENET